MTDKNQDAEFRLTLLGRYLAQVEFTNEAGGWVYSSDEIADCTLELPGIAMSFTAYGRPCCVCIDADLIRDIPAVLLALLFGTDARRITLRPEKDYDWFDIRGIYTYRRTLRSFAKELTAMRECFGPSGEIGPMALNPALRLDSNSTAGYMIQEISADQEAEWLSTVARRVVDVLVINPTQ